MGNGELPTPPCGPHRQLLVWASSEPGNPGSERPQGSANLGVRPDRPHGPPRATRRPKTVRGRPPPSQSADADEVLTNVGTVSILTPSSLCRVSTSGANACVSLAV